MGFEPTTLCDLVGCLNHQMTGNSVVSKGEIWVQMLSEYQVFPSSHWPSIISFMCFSHKSFGWMLKWQRIFGFQNFHWWEERLSCFGCEICWQSKLQLNFMHYFQVIYTLFQNGRHISILLFPCKMALLALLSNIRFKRIFNPSTPKPA